MPNYPKFEARVRERVLNPALQQAQRPGYGVVLSFDKRANTCDIVTAQPGSDQMGEVISSVPAPVQSGVQGASPRPGMLCWIDYRDGGASHPFITHFFNPYFQNNDYNKQYKAVMDTPRYLLNL